MASEEFNGRRVVSAAVGGEEISGAVWLNRRMEDEDLVLGLFFFFG